MAKTISAWSICVVWSDGTQEVHTQVPQYTANAIDQYCDALESQMESKATGDETTVWQAYDGICPDCGEDIPTDVVEGQECANCGHSFHPIREND